MVWFTSVILSERSESKDPLCPLKENGFFDFAEKFFEFSAPLRMTTLI